MKQLKTGMYMILMGAMICSLTACAATGSRMAASNDGDCAIKPGQQVMITGVSDNDHIRKQFEDALCRELKNQGVEAVASYSAIPEASGLDRETLLKQANNREIDFVLLARVAGMEQTYAYSSYDPVLFYLGPGDTGGNWSAHQQQYIRQNATAWKHVMVEARLYDTKNRNPLWSDTLDIARPAKTLTVQKVINKAVKQIPRAVSGHCPTSS